MEKQAKEMSFMFFRYLFLLLIAIDNLFIIYAVVSPITIYLSFFLIKAVYAGASLAGSTVLISNSAISLIPACIAGAAYYFLLILNFAVPMPLKTRVKSLAFLLLSFLLLNVIRIFIFSMLFVQGFSYFSVSHAIVWHLGSTILLVILWFASVKLFKITEIPVYSDVKNILNLVKKS